MLGALPLLQNIMQDWAQQTDDFQAWESKLKNLEEMHSMLSEALMNNQHSLYSLSDRFVFFKMNCNICFYACKIACITFQNKVIFNVLKSE